MSSRKSSTERRVERFVHKYVDSPVKADLIRTLAFRPASFHSMAELLVFTRCNQTDLERAIYSLRHDGLVVTRQGPHGTVVGLAPSSAVRGIAGQVRRYLKNNGEAPAPSTGESDL